MPNLPRLLTLLSVVFAMTASPVSAADITSVAAMAFDGAVSFPAVPCVPSHAEDCAGSMQAEWTGQAAGRVGGRPFEVTWKTLSGALVGAFQYTERACDGSGGTASGRVTATAAPGSMSGTWVHGGNDTFPRAITGLDLAFTFKWTRAHGTATLRVDRLVLSFRVAGLRDPVQIAHGAMELPARMPGGGCGRSVTSPVTGTATFTRA